MNPDIFETRSYCGGSPVVVVMIGVILWAVLAGIFLAQTGCTYTRNAPLIERNAPLIDANLNNVEGLPK